MSNDIRKILNHLMELDLQAKRPDTDTPDDAQLTKVDLKGLQRDNTGRIDHPDFQYEVSTDKVIAKLSSFNSQSYTKLAQKLQRIDALEAEIKKLKEETKAEVKTEIADLFAAEDTTRTRVVETVSFIFQLTKDPKATETPKYKDILEELSKSLTPELIAVLENLKKTMKTVTQKSPALSLNAKESVNEGVFDKAMGVIRSLYAKITSWAERYDAKLDALKAEAGLSEDMPEPEMAESIDFNRVDRIEKQVDFMARNGKGRAEIVGNIAAKMGDEEAEHAGLYYDEFHNTNESAVASNVKPDSLYGFKYMGQKMETVDEHTDLDVQESLNEDDFESLDESLEREYKALVEGNSFKVGDTVFCGSRKGTVVADQMPNKPNLIVVELPNGERDVFPKERTEHGDVPARADNPGMLRRAMSWVVGEDQEDDKDIPVDNSWERDVEWDQYSQEFKFPSSDAFIDFYVSIRGDSSANPMEDIARFQGDDMQAAQRVVNDHSIVVRGDGTFKVPGEAFWQDLSDVPEKYRSQIEKCVADCYDAAKGDLGEF